MVLRQIAVGSTTTVVMGEGEGFQSCGISELAVVVHSNDESNDHLIPIPAREENRIQVPTGKLCK